MPRLKSIEILHSGRLAEWAIALLIVGWLAWCVYYYDAGKFRSMYDEIQRLRIYGGDVPQD